VAALAVIEKANRCSQLADRLSAMHWLDDDLTDLTESELFERLVSLTELQERVAAKRRELVVELDVRRHPAA
jgi:hypothetical protein